MFAFTSIKSEPPHDAENALENTSTIFTPVTEEIIITSDADSNEVENLEQKCKRKRTFFPLEYKLNILNELKDSKISEVSLKYNISQRTIRKWKIKEHDLRDTFSNMKKETNFDTIDNAVYVWFKDITDQGLRVKSSEIKEKCPDCEFIFKIAKAVEIGHGLGERISAAGSCTWFEKWKENYNIQDHLFKDNCGIRVIEGQDEQLDSEEINTEEIEIHETKPYVTKVPDDEAVESLTKLIKYFEDNGVATPLEMEILERLKKKAIEVQKNEYRESPEFFICK